MTLIDRHVLSECLQTLGLALGAILGLLILQNMFDNLKDLIDYGASFKDIVFYYIVLLPSMLPAVLPLSFMISILFGLGQLHRNNEITAMQAVGLSLWRITRSIWVMGAVLSALLFYLNSQLVPWSVEQARQVWENYAFSAELREKTEDQVGIVPALAYYNHAENRLWFINRFSEFNFRAYGITVSQLDSRQRELTRVAANEGYFDDTPGYGYWVLKNGREVTFEPETGKPIRSLPFDERAYETFVDNPVLMKLREQRPQDLSFNEIRRVLGSISLDRDPDALAYQVRYYSMMANPFICLIVVGLSVPFAASGVRINPMVGISKAIGLFLGYYAINSVATLLGSQGSVSPILAAWLPSLAAVGVAIWLNIRARFA